MRHPCQKLRSRNILKTNIAGTSCCCRGVAKETAKPIPSSSGGSAWLVDPSGSSAHHGFSGMCFNMANIPSAVCAFLWQRQMHQQNIFQKGSAAEGSTPGTLPGSYDTANCLIQRLAVTAEPQCSEMVHVSRNRFSIYAPRPLLLVVPSVLKRR